jgi:hypothetical protein
MTFPPKPNEPQQTPPPAGIAQPNTPTPPQQLAPPPQQIPVKIFVGLPCRDLPMVDFRFADSWHQMMNTLPPGSGYLPAWQYGAAETRQKLVEEFLKVPDYTHLLFWDTDTVVPISVDAGKPTWLSMLEANQPIVSGIYLNSLRTGINAWIGGRVVNLQQNPNAIPLMQAEDMGFGFTLIFRGIFEQLAQRNIPKPWFYYRSSANPGEMLSEDFYFLRLVFKELGIRPYIDTRIRCIHLKTYGFNVDGTIAG